MVDRPLEVGPCGRIGGDETVAASRRHRIEEVAAPLTSRTAAAAWVFRVVSRRGHLCPPKEGVRPHTSDRGLLEAVDAMTV